MLNNWLRWIWHLCQMRYAKPIPLGIGICNHNRKISHSTHQSSAITTQVVWISDSDIEELKN